MNSDISHWGSFFTSHTTTHLPLGVIFVGGPLRWGLTMMLNVLPLVRNLAADWWSPRSCVTLSNLVSISNLTSNV